MQKVRNPVAKQIKRFKNQIVRPKKGKGSYKRKGRVYRPFSMHFSHDRASKSSLSNFWGRNRLVIYPFKHPTLLKITRSRSRATNATMSHSFSVSGRFFPPCAKEN